MKKLFSHNILSIIFTLIFCAVAVFIIWANWQHFSQAIMHANIALLIPAIIFTILSYLCLSIAFAIICRLFQIPLSMTELSLIGFISIVLNHAVSTLGGLPGYSLRLLLAKYKHVSATKMLGASLVQSYYGNAVVIFFLPIGFIYLFHTNVLNGKQVFFIPLSIALTITLFIIAAVIFINNKIRLAVLSKISAMVRAVTKKDIAPTIEHFDNTISNAITVFRQKPSTAFLPLLFSILDWWFTIAVLLLCFMALGQPIPLLLLVTGLIFGSVLGFISPAPGGLGVQEAAMTTTYTLLGIPFRTAILAAILFRLIYYIVPFLLSLGIQAIVIHKYQRQED